MSDGGIPASPGTPPQLEPSQLVPVPLVDPADDLDPDELRRYSRHVILPSVGLLGQRRLKNARVLVVGAGGLGSPALMYLAAAGVGTLGVVDADVVELSNLQRQVIHGQSDLGRLKVDSVREAVLELNQRVRVRTHPVRLDAANALEILGQYDLVLDGTDNFPTRYLVGDACALLGLPDVWGSIYRFDGQVSVFWSGRGPVYRDLFPVPPPAGSVPSCAEGGVLGVLCAAIGSVMATEAIKLICGIGEPLVGRLMVFDALAMSWRTVRVRADPDRPPVRELVDYDAFCAAGSAGAGSAGAGSAGTGASGTGASGTGDTIDASTLAGWLAARGRGETEFALLDVREPYERQIVAIPGSLSVPRDDIVSGRALADLPAGRLVLYCKSGARSAEALSSLHAAGRTDAVHLDGGVLAWVRDVDPGLATY